MRPELPESLPPLPYLIRLGGKAVSEYKLKTPKKIEETVVGSYKKMESSVVGAYKKIENKFVDAFLEKAADPADGGEENP